MRKGWLAWQFHRRTKKRKRGSGRVGVLFFESWRVDLVTCSRRGLPRAVWGSGKGWLGARHGANFATCVVFLSFLTFLKDALWGGGGSPPELAWWTGA